MANNQNVPGSLKTENTYKRLSSFKSPRDLNLSQFTNSVSESRTKKVFVPNLNVQRRKQNEKAEGGGVEERRQAEGGKRGRGTGRPKREFVQTTGVFSEGLAPPVKNRSSRATLYDSSASSTRLSQRTAGSRTSLKEEEDDKVMKDLLRDDFIEGGVQPDMENCPVQLPLAKLENLKIEPLKEEPKLAHEDLSKNGIRIKSEPGVEAERPEVGSSSQTLPITAGDLRPLSTAQLIAQANSSDFIFFQIPKSLPRLKVPESAQPKPSKSAQKDTEDGEGLDRQTLRSLPAGRIGTLQILRSGRARLLLGDVKLQLEPATQVAFKQDLVSVDLDKDQKTGNMINMGRISTRMLVTPDWESLLSAPPR